MKLERAVAQARQHFDESFIGQRITWVGIDATVLNHHLRIWAVTLGFARPDDSAGCARR